MRSLILVLLAALTTSAGGFDVVSTGTIQDIGPLGDPLEIEFGSTPTLTRIVFTG